jgi:hypothetical protein
LRVSNGEFSRRFHYAGETRAVADIITRADRGERLEHGLFSTRPDHTRHSATIGDLTILPSCRS